MGDRFVHTRDVSLPCKHVRFSPFFAELRQNRDGRKRVYYSHMGREQWKEENFLLGGKWDGIGRNRNQKKARGALHFPSLCDVGCGLPTAAVPVVRKLSIFQNFP